MLFYHFQTYLHVYSGRNINFVCTHKRESMDTSKVERVDFYSKMLDKEMSMQIYIPVGYDKFSRLPVLYFLHGRSGDENLIFEINLNEKADKLIKEGKISPMIIVCPRMENSRGINSSPISKIIPNSVTDERKVYLGKYEDYFIEEIIPLIDRSFKTIAGKKGRYIGGASAGGYAALHNAFRHSDMFSKVGGHMPALELELDDDAKPFYGNMDVWNKYDPLYIVKNNNILSDIKVYLDAGDKDEGRFFEGCSILHELLKEKGIQSQNYVFPGNHNTGYIKQNIEEYLKFYGANN